MMATVLHITSGLGLRKFQADGFFLTRVYASQTRTKVNNTKYSICTFCVKVHTEFCTHIFHNTFRW